MWNRKTAQRVIIIAGCCSMAYTQLTMSPATIEFARSLGAGGVHIGLLGALPTGMLFLQFVSAVVANHLRYRRWLWIAVSLVQRLLFLPVAFGPLLFPQSPTALWIWALIGLTAVNHGLLNFATPLWLSWMGDYLPREGLSRFWGVRHLWMQWTAVGTLLVSAILLATSGLEVRLAFAVLITLGALLGVADILLFLRIEEPPVQPAEELKLSAVFSEPFRHPGFRSFIAYGCFWNVAAMVGAPFISLYLLAHVGMSLFGVLLLWAASWVGGAMFSARLGGWVEQYGNRPILVAATLFKSVNMIALLLVPSDAVTAFWLLVPVFMLDASLNAAIAIASNGFLLKNSPAENRSMFIAAGTAIAGMAGGLTSIVAGMALSAIGSGTVLVGERVFNGFHILFLASLLLRWISVFFARRVHEPESRPTTHVLSLLVGATPLRFMRFPFGLYWSRFGREQNGSLTPAQTAADDSQVESTTRLRPATALTTDEKD